MPRQDEHAFLQQVLRQNAGAVAFCETLFRISQTLDDLIDGDKPVSGDAVVSAFWQALIEMPANPFYRQFEPYLRPLMAGALQDWRDSVALERTGSRHDRTLAFVLRDQLTSIVIQCAYLIEGEQWMRQVGPVVRRHFHEDGLEEYLADLSGDSTQDAAYQADVDESLNGGES